MAEIHHFTYGFFNPLAAFMMSVVGSLIGLACARRARAARTRGRSTRWLVLGAVAIGGAALWLMSFMALLGFDVPDGAVRYDPAVTFASLLAAVLPVYLGLFIVARWRRFAPRLLGGAVFTGLGVVAMHYGGMYALRVTGDVTYESRLLGAAAGIAVLGAGVALCLVMLTKGWGSTVLAATVLGAAACGSHYLGMAALQVRLPETAVATVEGVSAFQLIVPITLLASVALIGTAFSALQAMTEEEFDGPEPRPGRSSERIEPGPRGGAHAEVPWQLADGASTGRVAPLAPADAPTPMAPVLLAETPVIAPVAALPVAEPAGLTTSDRLTGPHPAL